MGNLCSFQICKDPKQKRRILLAFTLVMGVCLLLMIILLPILIPGKRPKTGPDDRIECPGFKDGTECKSRGCVYNIFKSGPSCYMNKESFGYKKVSMEPRKDGMTVKLVNRSAETPYGPSWTSVVFETFYVTENVVRVKLRPSEKQRYEVPVQEDFPLLKQQTVNTDQLTYGVTIIEENGIFAFQIKRSSDGTVLWDTKIGGLLLSDQFLQMASYLPSRNVYGLGEHTHETLRHDMEYKTWPMFSRDRPPEGGQVNLYGVHPFYTCLEKSTKSHGVLLLNSNAMEVTLMPSPAISFRTIGGILDLFFFVGDNPEHVVQLYTSLVGRPPLPPYWGLGFQLSRYGYNSLEKVKEAVERTRNANIAQDVQFLDIDHMQENRDFTISKENFKGLIDYIQKTKSEYDLKWIIILDPAISAFQDYDVYESGLKDEVFIKRSPDWNPDIFPEELRNVNVTFGRVWPNEEVAFPDFFNKKAENWWIDTIVNYHKTLPFDGLWIDMNEPANFGTNEEKPFYCEWSKKPECWVLKCPQNIYDDPPYNPLKSSGSERLSKMTLCMTSVQSKGEKSPLLHYDVHSLYGWSQSQPTLKAAIKATKTRSLVISRSTYPSSGRYAGHWLGDNKSTWDDLRRSIIGMLEFNLFGIPYIGADVCGFFKDTTEELCSRWMQLGAFYPFFRNHNGMGQKEQDPAALGETVQETSRLAVQRRYNLRPYLYTLFYRSHVDGSTVVRPLFHEFPDDENTWNNGEQFMWGRCVLVSPVLKEGQTSVRMYLPKTEWWHFRYNESSQERTNGDYVEQEDVSNLIPMHVRGGCILPTEEYRLKTPNADPPTRNLFIFPLQDKASGELYIDDGLSIDPFEKKDYILYKFTYHKCKIEFKKEGNGKGKYADSILEKVYVYKVKAVDQVVINTAGKYRSLYFNGATNFMTVDVSKRMMDVDTITWTDENNECQMLP